MENEPNLSFVFDRCKWIKWIEIQGASHCVWCKVNSNRINHMNIHNIKDRSYDAHTITRIWHLFIHFYSLTHIHSQPQPQTGTQLTQSHTHTINKPFNSFTFILFRTRHQSTLRLHSTLHSIHINIVYMHKIILYEIWFNIFASIFCSRSQFFYCFFICYSFLSLSYTHNVQSVCLCFFFWLHKKTAHLWH